MSTDRPEEMPLRAEGVRLHAGAPPLDLELPRGEALAVVGGNGTGKSRLLAGLLGQFHSSGRIDIYGIPVHRAARRRKALEPVGVLFQENGLLRDLTVWENIALPYRVRGQFREHLFHDDVEALLGLFGCEHLAENFPSELSSGEARRVALARSFSGNSSLIFADEPLLGLSEDGRHDVIELLQVALRESLIDGLVVFTEDQRLARQLTGEAIELYRDQNVFGFHHRVVYESESADDDGAPDAFPHSL